MREVANAFISEAGVVFIETKDGGLQPFIPLLPVAEMLEKIGCEYEAKGLRTLITSE